MTSNCLQFAAARTSRAKLLTILLAALCIHGSSPGAQMTPYTFYQVNAGYSPAMDVNDAGTVVGYWVGPPVSADPTSTSLGYVWTRADGAQPIIVDPTTVKQFPQRTPINEPSASLRISGAGTVAGAACLQGFTCADRRAAIWNPSQGLVSLGSFDNNQNTSAAAGVNSSGQVVGYSWGGGYNNLGPFIWSDADGLQHLTGFRGINGHATGINENGVVVGWQAGARQLAYVWSAASGQTDIPDLPGATASVGLAINDDGAVVGRYTAADGTSRVFRWSAGSGTEDLNAPAGYPELLDINNAGDVLASIIAQGGGAVVPSLYRNGAWTNVNDLMPSGTNFTIQDVTAINNRGWIVGEGTSDPNGAQLGQGFVLIPPNRGPGGGRRCHFNGRRHRIERRPQGERRRRRFPQLQHRGERLLRVRAIITNTATGAFSYTPNANAYGTGLVHFQRQRRHGRFECCDRDGDDHVCQRCARFAADAAASTNAGGTVTGTLVASDVDNASLTFTIGTNGNKGVATVTDAGTGAYSYTANAGSSGTDMFTFKATDGSLDSNVASVTVTISNGCAIDITGLIAISQGPMKLNRKTGRYTQTLTLKNSDGPVTGPISLVHRQFKLQRIAAEPNRCNRLRRPGRQSIPECGCRL